MAIKRVMIEVSPAERPFAEGETLWTYAQRIVQQYGIDGTVSGADGYVHVEEVSAIGDKIPYAIGDKIPQWVVGYEIVTIEVTMKL